MEENKPEKVIPPYIPFTGLIDLSEAYERIKDDSWLISDEMLLDINK